MSTDPANPNSLAARIREKPKGDRRREPIDCGHFDIRIGRDGTWHYRGSPIHRKPLVTLFSSVLKRDDSGQFWLETPVERGRIDVDDAPFTAIQLEITGSGNSHVLTLHTNLDETLTVDADHPLRVETDPATGEPSPYVRVRDNMDALIVRSVFYELVEMAEPKPGTDILGVWSSGIFFELGDAGAGE